MMTYNTLTAGASEASGTIPNPAARTAADWKRAATMRLPTLRSVIALRLVTSFADFLAKAKGQKKDALGTDIKYKETDEIDHPSLSAFHSSRFDLGDTRRCLMVDDDVATHVRLKMTKAKNQVCVEGNM